MTQLTSSPRLPEDDASIGSRRVQDPGAARDRSLVDVATNQEEGFESIVEVDIDDWCVEAIEE